MDNAGGDILYFGVYYAAPPATEIVEADEYKPEGTVCVFYEGETARRIVPLYMLEKVEKVSDE